MDAIVALSSATVTSSQKHTTWPASGFVLMASGSQCGRRPVPGFLLSANHHCLVRRESDALWPVEDRRTAMVNSRTVDVAIIGGGPAGLTAAATLRHLGVDKVVVLEREQGAGGIPRHCGNPTFGLSDFKRPMTGPTYARRLVERTEAAGVEINLMTTVLEIGHRQNASVLTTSPTGMMQWDASAVILASGCRERPRSARLIPGMRSAGVYTTGELQQFTYLQNRTIGRRAVVLGAEHVSFSAVMTLHHAGIEVAAMVTPSPKHQTYGLVRSFVTRLRSVPVLVGHQLVEILGTDRVSGVIVEDPQAERRHIPCDTVIVTGDWVANGPLAIDAGLSSDIRSGGLPEVDSLGRTTLESVFSAGGVVRPGESSSKAAQAGSVVARAVHAYLQGDNAPAEPGLRVSITSPIRWASPQVLRPKHTGPIHLRVDRWIEPAVVHVSWRGSVIEGVRFRRMMPGRTYKLDDSWLRSMRASAMGEVKLSIEGSS